MSRESAAVPDEERNGAAVRTDESTGKVRTDAESNRTRTADESNRTRTDGESSRTLTDGGTADPFDFDTQNLERKRLVGKVFVAVCFASTLVGIIALLTLIGDVISEAWGWLDWTFLTYPPSRFIESYRPGGRGAGIYPALVGSIFLIALTAVFTMFLGVGAAIYLEEYARETRFKAFIEANIANLAGVPSIVYGLLGLAIFVRAIQLGTSLIAGALTLTLLILPIVIVASQEALRAVPDSQRNAAYAVGATDWEVIRDVVLPRATPGIMTGIILSLSRAIGETAPILMVGAATSMFTAPYSLTGPFSAMPMQIFDWARLPADDFQHVAAAGIVVLLTVLLLMNATAIYIRNRYETPET